MRTHKFTGSLTSSEECNVEYPLSSSAESVAWSELDFEGQLSPNGVGFLSLPVVIKRLYLIYLITVIMTGVIDINGTLTCCWATLSISCMIISFYPHICILGGCCDYLVHCTEERNNIWVSIRHVHHLTEFRIWIWTELEWCYFQRPFTDLVTHSCMNSFIHSWGWTEGLTYNIQTLYWLSLHPQDAFKLFKFGDGVSFGGFRTHHHPSGPWVCDPPAQSPDQL